MADSPVFACFIPVGADSYEPTAHTGGAWRDDEQHLAPVAGLMVHHMERWREANADPSLEFSRFSFDVLGQIPRDTVSLETRVIRPGRTIELIECTAAIGGRAIIRARAWLLQAADSSSVAGHEFEQLALPTDESPIHPLAAVWGGGFIDSVRAVSVGELSPGRGRMWITSDLELVHGEPVSELAEFMKFVDTANGAATRVPPGEWMYPNVDLTIHLFRRPRGPWLGVDTRVAFGGAGIGLTSSVLHDLDGPVGTVEQALTIRKLSPSSVGL